MIARLPEVPAGSCRLGRSIACVFVGIVSVATVAGLWFAERGSARGEAENAQIAFLREETESDESPFQ
jgi:hypothetical protein